jgi:hypothetical protein
MTEGVDQFPIRLSVESNSLSVIARMVSIDGIKAGYNMCVMETYIENIMRIPEILILKR